MKRFIFGLLAAMLASSAFAQTLDAWSWRTEDIDAYNELFSAYEAAHPGVTVNFEAFLNTEYNTLTATSLQAGEAGDVVMTRSYGGVKPWIDGGYLVPLDSKVDSLSNFSPTALDAVRSQENGQVYGVPFAIQTLQVYYNKRIFDELGLSEPQTWDEFITLNQTLLDAGYIPLAITGKDAWMLPIFHSIVGAGAYGGNDFVEGHPERQPHLRRPGLCRELGGGERTATLHAARRDRGVVHGHPKLVRQRTRRDVSWRFLGSGLFSCAKPGFRNGRVRCPSQGN